MNNKNLTTFTLNSTGPITTIDNMQQELVLKSKSSQKLVELQSNVTVGLVKPENVDKLTGEISDKKWLVPIEEKIYYTIGGILKGAEAWIDNQMRLHFDSSNAANSTKDAIIKITCVICNYLECVKSTLTLHLSPARGYIRGKEASGEIFVGEELDPLHISHLFTKDNQPQSSAKSSGNENPALEENDKKEEQKSEL
ncbi:hypothetical protein GAMM_260008 [Gammaproteobacteria bacterium]